MTERGTHVLVDCYANAPRRVERVAPADVAARRIGHFGFFRDAFAADPLGPDRGLAFRIPPGEGDDDMSIRPRP